MHQVTVGDYDILLANVNGEVYAVENKCSHYKFALTKGALCEHRVRCPLHHACFDVRTGEQIEGPGMDGVARFEVSVAGDKISVSEEPVATNTPHLNGQAKALKRGADHYTYAIVGGGTAAAYAVESIREHDPEGSIVMFSQDELPPYDRTKVSKNFLQEDNNEQSLVLRDQDFYPRLGVDFRARTRVQSVDLKEKRIRLDGGATLTYDKILLATGGKPRMLDVPGADLDGVYTIRSAADGEAARAATEEGTDVVIVGASFIGLETAMSLGKRGGNITVIAPEEKPFAGVFGDEVAQYVRDLHDAAGVHFELESKCTEIKGRDGKVTGVVLDSGKELPAEVVIIGIGVTPDLDYLEGIAYQKDGSVAVDGHLALHGDSAWAAGDIATYPDREGMLRIEHWKVAGQQGRVAGRNMAGKSEPYQMVPYFWTNQQGNNFRYVGHATDYDDIIFDGTPGEDPFLAFYIKDRHVQACLGVKRDAEAAAVNELMALGKMPPVDDLKGKDWLQLCREV